MQQGNDLKDVMLERPSWVTIGVFDGVHLGHQALIRQLVESAHVADQNAVVITFHPHPDVVLRQIEDRYYLTSPQQRAKLLHDLGVDVVITQPFNDELRQVRATEYVDRLQHHLQLRSLWVGTDFALGYQREGTVAYLTQLGQERGYEVRPFHLVTTDGNGGIITSTRIRGLLNEGDVIKAGELLGRSYAVQGEVIHGDKRGRTIGFPTANMSIWEGQVLPLNGVYAGYVTIGDERFKAVANVGIRPTFEGDEVRVEPHLLDFDRDIYGQTISFSFEHRLRGEMKFSGLDELKAQLSQDIQQGRDLLSKEAE